MLRPLLICVLALLLPVGAQAADAHALFGGELSFTPPTGDEKQGAGDGVRLVEYRSSDERDERMPIEFRWTLSEYRAADARTPAEMLRARYEDVYAKLKAGTNTFASGGAAIGANASLLIVTERVGGGQLGTTRRYLADYLANGHHAAIEVAVTLPHEADFPSKSTADFDAGVEAFLAAMRTRNGAHPFGKKPVKDALAQKPPIEPLGETVTLFDGALSIDLPLGDPKRTEHERSRSIEITVPGLRFREMRWDIGEWTKALTGPATAADQLAQRLRDIAFNQGLGNHTIALGAAQLDPTACLVVVDDNHGFAQRLWWADYLADGHHCYIQMTYTNGEKTLTAAEIAERDAEVTRFLAAIRTADGKHPFGEGAVAVALKTRPEMGEKK